MIFVKNTWAVREARPGVLEIDVGKRLPGAVRHDEAGTVLTPPRLNSALVFKTEQARLPEYCSINMWRRFLDTAHELGGEQNVLALSLSNSSTDQGGGKRGAALYHE